MDLKKILINFYNNNKYYMLFPLYIVFLILINLIPKEHFVWSHTLFMLVTIALGVLIIIKGDEFIPHWFKPKVQNINYKKYEGDKMAEITEEIKKKYEVL